MTSSDEKKISLTFRELGISSSDRKEKLLKDAAKELRQRAANIAYRAFNITAYIQIQVSDEVDESIWVDLVDDADSKNCSELFTVTADCVPCPHVIVICGPEQDTIRAYALAERIWPNFKGIVHPVAHRISLRQVHAYPQGTPYTVLPGTPYASWHNGDIAYHVKCGKLIYVDHNTSPLDSGGDTRVSSGD